MTTITKQQLKLLRYLYRNPRTVAWIKKKFKVSGLREICSGMFTLISSTDGHFPDDCIVSINQNGIIEVESHQWFNGQFVLTFSRYSYHLCYSYSDKASDNSSEYRKLYLINEVFYFLVHLPHLLLFFFGIF